MPVPMAGASGRGRSCCGWVPRAFSITTAVLSAAGMALGVCSNSLPTAITLLMASGLPIMVLSGALLLSSIMNFVLDWWSRGSATPEELDVVAEDVQVGAQVAAAVREGEKELDAAIPAMQQATHELTEDGRRLQQRIEELEGENRRLEAALQQAQASTAATSAAVSAEEQVAHELDDVDHQKAVAATALAKTADVLERVLQRFQQGDGAAGSASLIEHVRAAFTGHETTRIIELVQGLLHVNQQLSSDKERLTNEVRVLTQSVTDLTTALERIGVQ